MSIFSSIKIILIIKIIILPKINTQTNDLFTTYKKGTPGDYLEYDDYFQNENNYPLEKYHYITAAWAANNGYVDEYSGLYYDQLRCSWRDDDKYTYISKDIHITDLYDINVTSTNLVGLLSKVCYFNQTFNNFAVWQYRNSNDETSYSVIIKFANTFDDDILMEVNTCSNYDYSNCNANTKHNITIYAHSTLNYTIKWNKTHIIYINQNKENDKIFEETMSSKGYIYFNNFNHTIIKEGFSDTTTYIYINSVVFRAEMFKYKLSLSGDSMNYCYNYGCHSGYYCQLHYTNNDHTQNGCYDYNNPIKGFCNLRGCVQGAFCDATNGLYLCKECDIRCRTCFDSMPNHCMSCYPTSTSPSWYTNNYYKDKTKCIHEFISLKNFKNFQMSIPLFLNYRGTVEFWIFVVNPQKMTDSNLQTSFSSFVFQKFFTLIIHHNEINIKDIDITLIPLDNLYPYSKNIANINSFQTYYSNIYPNYESVTKTYTEKESKWFFVRAGFSYTHKKMHVDDNERDISFPKPFLDNSITYETYQRTFYRKFEKGILIVQGFQYINTDIYIRNFNCYSEYINNHINNPNYFNMHKINNVYDIPYLLFVIPFNDIDIEADSTNSIFTFYDYSNQFTLDYSTDKNVIIQSTITIQLIPSSLAPSKNFHRIKFYSEKNKRYTNTDLKDLESYSCDSPSSYCSTDNEPYACQNNYNLFYDYSNNIKQCVTQCQISSSENYMRLPSIKTNLTTENPFQNDICSFKCDYEKVENCPSSNNDDINNFKCDDDYYTLFYQCLNKNNYNIENSALQFSGTYRTKSIYFPLVSSGSTGKSNFMVEIWFHPDLHTQPNPPLQKQFIFMSDSHQIYFDNDQQEYLFKSITNGFTSIHELGFNIYYYGWNHLIISSRTIKVNDIDYTEFNISVANSFSKVDQVAGINTIRKICFCNIDENCCGESNVMWLDMFIKDIKLWDLSYVGPYTLFDFDKFSYIIPKGLLNWYNLDITNLNNNDIKCKIVPTLKATFEFDEKVLNPHNDQNYNYGFNFNWNDINYPRFVVNTQIISTKNVVNITETGECYEGCKQCFGDSKYNCFKCNEHYALNGATCTLDSQFDSYYYYINPLKNGDELKLNFGTEINNFAGITIFFYMKLYGFTNDVTVATLSTSENVYDIVYFNSTKNFKLSYNLNKGSLQLVLNNIPHFQFNDFASKIATWVPISIAAFRAPSSIQKNFASMTVDSSPLEFLHTTYLKYQFISFIFSKYMIGHITDLTIFNSFIINALGYASHKDNSNSIFSSSNINGLNLIYKTFPLKYKISPNKITNADGVATGVSSWPTSTQHCLDDLDITDLTTIKPNAKCTEDYITYTDQKCEDNQFVKYNTANYPPTCVENASKCSDITQVLKRMDTTCDYLVATCDNKSLNSINNLIFSYIDNTNKKYIICGSANGLDIARFNPGTISNIISPTDEFKMEFWFLTQSYVNNNFRKLTITWTGHIKIIITYDSVLNKYKANCIGLDSSNNEVYFTYSEINTEDNKWRYVVCGVDIPNNEIYVTNLQKENQLLNYKKNLVDVNIPSSSLTTLIIEENSPTNFGVTYIKELRLWKCYDCSSDKAFVFFNRDDEFFDKVIHYFKFEDPKGLLKDYRIRINTGDDDISVQFTTKSDFNGYGLLNEIPNAPNCNEAGSMYYSLKTASGCDILFNFNIFKTDVVFDNVPAARANRYTMDFWFYVESADDFTKGFNIIFEDHIAISSFATSTTDTDITVYCFPQAYRNNLLNVFGDDILSRYNVAQNTISDTYSNGYSKWNYVRCAYSYDLQKYYLNNVENDLQKEIFFSNPSNKRNEKGFKMFMKNLVKVIMNVSRDNYTRIFLQTLNIFRDYIPKNIITKYIKMKEYIVSITDNYYYPLLFSVDFPNDYDIITNRLKYYITDYDYIPQTEQYLNSFMTNIFSRSYSTYPVYEPFLECGVGKILKINDNIPYCDYILSPDNCNAINTFCLDTNKFFWCGKNTYLNINDFTCNSNCPSGYTRPSDINDGYGMCYIPASDLNYNNYPTSHDDLAVNTYENKIECASGYTLVNYHCIQNTQNTALYFNNKYYFTNAIATFNTLLIKNYYVDFWIMFDLSESYRYSDFENDENRYYIFIAFPHIISRYKDKIQYSNGYVVNNYTDIISINSILYQWNRFVIENYVVQGVNLATTFKYVNIYLNNNYEQASMSLRINNDNDFSISQIAFCSGTNDKWSSCTVGLTSGNYKIFQDIIWEDAYYKDIIVWNRDSTNIASINSFGTPLNNDITMNIVAYYPFTVNTLNLGKIKSMVTYKGVNLDFEFKYNTEIQYDHSAQVNWVNNFDITISDSTTSDNYIVSIDNSNYINKDTTPYFSLNTNQYVTQPCSNNCYKCFSSGSDKCISCKSGFLLSGSKCISPTNYYFSTPVDNGSNNPIEINFDLETYTEMTFMVYMKFLGSVSIREGIVPLIYFYEQENYFGWDNDNNQFILVYKYNGVEKIPYKYKNSRISIGKWALYSISIYKSQYEGIFPNMIQLMIDNISLPIDMDINTLNNDIINFNKISFSNTISALYYDFRIYNKFYIGAYSLGQQHDTSSHSTLQKQIMLKSTSTGTSCLTSSDVTISLGSTPYCIGDDNMYDDSDYQCTDTTKEQFRIINSISHTSSCIDCNEKCDSKCYDSDEKGCICSYDSNIYLLRYIKSAKVDNGEKMFYCQKPDSLNLNEFNNIRVNVGLGSTTSYMLEVWIYVYCYISNDNYLGSSIDWWDFIKITVAKNTEDNNYLDITCYPYSKEEENGIKDSTNKFDQWVFIRCLVDKENLFIKLNDNKKTYTTEIIEHLNGEQPTIGSSMIQLIDNNQHNAYGLFLIRELRLWNSKTMLFYDTAHLNLATDATYPNLIHYFKNVYTDGSDRQFIFDSKTNTNTTLNNPLIPNYPYSYIPENYAQLVLCEEGDNYKLNEITNVYECSSYGSDDILDNIKKDKSTLSPSELLSKTKMLYNMAVNDYESPLNNNDQFYTSITINSEGKFEYTDAEISTTFCSNRGYVKIVDHTPTCYCYGDYTGRYCQLKKEDYANIDEIYSIYFDKLKVTYNSYKDNSGEMNNIYSAMNYLIDGLDYYIYENALLTEIVEWFSNTFNKNIESCNINYIKLIDKLYKTNFDLTNYYKVGNMANGKGNSRNAELSSGQKTLVDSNSYELYRMLTQKSALCFANCVNNEWNYNSENLNVDLIKVTNGFEIDSYLKNKKESSYKPYFQIGNCLNDVKKSSSGNLNIQFITWYHSPYYYDPNFIWNYTSHYLTIKIYNDEEYAEIPINGCSGNNQIEFYLILDNPILTKIINENKKHFYKENIFTSDDPIFTEPKYINSKGKVENSTREERIEKYYFDYLMKFDTFDAKTLNYSTEGLSYETITENNYFKCTSNHLSEFILNYIYNPYPTKIDGRLFFLKHGKLYSNSQNFEKNYGFYILLVILILYGLNFVSCYIRNRKKIKELNNQPIKFINEFLMEYVYPYGITENEYVINKETGNKIFNEDYENIEEKNLNFNEKYDVLSINKKNKKKKGKKNKKKDLTEYEDEFPSLKKNTNINLGNVKSKKLFSNFFNKMKKNPEIENSINEMETNGPLNTEGNNKKKKKHSFFEAKTENETNANDNKIETKKSNRSSFFMNDDDLIKNQIEKIKEGDDYVHNLNISNENQRLKLLLNMNISCWKFFKINFVNRNMFFNTWKSNATYTELSKSLFLPFYMQLMLFINTFVYLFEKDELTFTLYLKSHLLKFILFGLLAVILSNSYFYIKGFLYNIENGQMRSLLYDFKTNKELFENEYKRILKKIKIVSIVETVLFFIFWIINYIFSFGLCCVYVRQGTLMAISFLIGLALDFVLDVIIEFIIMIFYACRGNGLCLVMLDRINRMKSFKMLSP